jgi:hypothetical protein
LSFLLRSGLLWSTLRRLCVSDDGRIETDKNTVERVSGSITVTVKNALFAGSDGGARHWAIATTLIQTAKSNGLEPMAWLTDVLFELWS